MEVPRIGVIAVSIVLLIGAVGLILNGRISSVESEIAVLKDTAGIGPGAVNTLRLADSAVTTAKIKDLAVTTDKLEDSAVTSAKIADGTIVAGDIATGAVTSAKILDGTIETDDLKDSAVTSAKIASGAVIEAKIGTGAVTTAKIAAAAVDNTKLAENAVITGVIKDLAVTTAKIAAENVDNTSIAENAVAYSELRLKIRTGFENVSATGGTISHGLARVDNTGIRVVCTPRGVGNPTDNLMPTITALTGENFTVWLRDGVGTARAGEIFWLAIYEPTDWTY